MDATATMKGKRSWNIEGASKFWETPNMTCFAFAASDPNIDIQAVADVMETKGHYFNIKGLNPPYSFGYKKGPHAYLNDDT